MNCSDARQELTDRSEPTAAVRQHLDGCEECRSFLADLGLIQQAIGEPFSTPPALRENTLARSLELLEQKTAAAETSPWLRFRRALDSPRFVATAAALIVVIFVTWMSVQIGGSRDDETNLTMKVAIFQVLAQNVYAALFLPALLLLRGRLAGTATRQLKTGV
jgi:predicted anti-sigma-YlaC factor YlaD